MAADALEPLKLIGAGRSRSGNGDAGSGKVGLDFTKPGKAAAGFREKLLFAA